MLGQVLTGIRKGDKFGIKVGLGITDKDELILAVGASSAFDGVNNGRVDTYRLEGDIWNPLETIDEVEEYDGTGEALAISRDGLRLVVGSPYYSDQKGMVRVFDFKEEDSSFEFIGEEFLVGKYADEEFGKSVALFGLDLVIGSPFGNRVQMFKYEGETIYKGDTRQKKKGISTFLKLLVVVNIVFVAIPLCYVAFKKLKERGFRLSSMTRAMPTRGGTGANRRHTLVSTINANDAEANISAYPFPLIASQSGSDARIDGVPLHGMASGRVSTVDDDGTEGDSLELKQII